MKTATNIKGFTLIEVLVSLLILAIGVLGIAALQFKGLKFANDAYFRSQISFLAYDIADRMRLNAADPSTFVTDTNNPYTVGLTAPTTACTQTGTGTVTQANDLICWHHLIFNAMPPGSTATISEPSTDFFTVALAWTDREGQTHTINYSFRP